MVDFLETPQKYLLHKFVLITCLKIVLLLWFFLAIKTPSQPYSFWELNFYVKPFRLWCTGIHIQWIGGLLNISDDNSLFKIKYWNKQSISNDKCILFFPKCYNLLTPLFYPLLQTKCKLTEGNVTFLQLV